MDLRDQLKNLFPDHQEETSAENVTKNEHWWQTEPLVCKYEKRNGKPVTIIENFNGSDSDFKILAKELKTYLGVGGSVKNETIIIQGDYRDKIMDFLKNKGYKIKRVGG
ncbi:MAG: translation initiation factor [Capnocytophaga sp.]|nr:translation initiation factor [Capnocytophaga sp.]